MKELNTTFEGGPCDMPHANWITRCLPHDNLDRCLALRAMYLMHKLKIVALLIFFLTLTAQALGQRPNDTDGTILLGRDYSCVLKAPDKWVIGEKAPSSQDVQLALWKEGWSWKSAVVVMYVRVIHKCEEQPTVEKVIQNDIDDFLKLSRDSKVSDSPPISTRDKKQAIVKDFYDAANKNYESVAFIDETKVVVIVALSSRTKEEFDTSLPAFRALVGSYFYFDLLVKPDEADGAGDGIQTHNPRLGNLVPSFFR